MKTLIKKDLESMSQTLANLILPYLVSSERLNLSMTAGSTPNRAYELIKERLLASDSQVSESVHFFQQDNLYLSTEPTDYKRFEYINQSFFVANQIQDHQITYLNEETYPVIDQLLIEAGGLDFAIMGIGADGHIAANMPGTPFEKTGYRVMIPEDMQGMIQGSPDFNGPIDCYVSIGMKTLMQTKKIIVIASGADKAEILAKAFNGPLTPEIPASILQFHPDVTVLCDVAAGKNLV